MITNGGGWRSPGLSFARLTFVETTVTDPVAAIDRRVAVDVIGHF